MAYQALGTDPVDFGATLLAALLASGHCAGMCGGLALAASAGGRGRASQILYHLGKTTVYLGFGSVSALAGASLLRNLDAWGAGRALAFAAAAALIAVGIGQLGIFPVRRVKFVVAPGAIARASPVTSCLTWAGSRGSAWRALALGTLSGLLPCPLVYAFAAKAAAAGSLGGALATMLSLSLGSLPALLVVASSGRALPLAWRMRMARVSGAFLIGLGALTALRGFAVLPCCESA
jgi:hypothetical protein